MDADPVMVDSFTSIKRAGAGMIITCSALDAITGLQTSIVLFW